jgi:hypothetical protein
MTQQSKKKRSSLWCFFFFLLGFLFSPETQAAPLLPPSYREAPRQLPPTSDCLPKTFSLSSNAFASSCRSQNRLTHWRGNFLVPLVLTLLLPPIGITGNLWHMHQGLAGDRWLWGLANTIVFGAYALTGTMILLFVPLLSVDFWIFVGISAGCVLFMLFGVVNMILSFIKSIHRGNHLSSSMPAAKDIAEASSKLAEHSSFLPMWRMRF